MVLELDCGLDFDRSQAEENFFPALPPQPAVCLIESRENSAEPYLIRTQDLRQRLQRLLSPADPGSKRLNLRDFAQTVRYRLTASAFEQALTYYVHAKRLFPKRYRDLMRLRPPAVLKVNLRNAYPRCYVTRRISVDASGMPVGGAYYGPFPSRKYAEAFAERALDLFKVRRCQIKIRRDPSFPGCIYSEMKMCLAPCFAGCTKEEYDHEVARLVQFIETSGDSLRNAYEQERDQASEQLDFEKASSFHKKIEKLDEVLRGQPELARQIQKIDAVILQRAAGERTIGVYAIHGGWLAEPFYLRFAEMASEPRSVEEVLREHLESGPGEATGILLPSESSPSPMNTTSPQASRDTLSEHLWLIARWFYSNPREGEIFFREKDWPYRRILRACSRILAPQATQQ